MLLTLRKGARLKVEDPIQHSSASQTSVYCLIKRCLDIMMAIILLMILLPLMIGIVIVIRLSSGKPVIFKQTRIGKGKTPFVLYKFRTMVVGAQNMGKGVQTVENDSRITPIGRFLRVTSLDELPQLSNILLGSMSFVGPRPVLPDHPKKLVDYSTEESLRFSVKPGLTGWAQIHGRGSISWDEKLKYDAEYAKNMSFVLDTKIAWRTVLTVLSRSDVYLGDDKTNGN